MAKKKEAEVILEWTVRAEAKVSRSCQSHRAYEGKGRTLGAAVRTINVHMQKGLQQAKESIDRHVREMEAIEKETT